MELVSVPAIVAFTITVTTTVVMVYNFSSVPYHFTIRHTYRAVVIITGPMVAVFYIAAVAYNGLAGAAPVTCIFSAVGCCVGPGAWLVYNNFISIVNIIVAIP